MKKVERFRTMISLDPEVHQIFVRMAAASRLSVSRCMGDWLGDTVDAAQFITLKMEEARATPLKVMREMQAYASGLEEATQETLDNMRVKKRRAVAERSAPAKPPRKGRAEGPV